MGNRENIFDDYTYSEQLGDNFEEMVFHKIKKKKRQRTVAATSMGAFLLGGFLFMSVTSVPLDIFIPQQNHIILLYGLYLREFQEFYFQNIFLEFAVQNCSFVP